MVFRRQTRICREGWYYFALMVVVFGGAIINEVNLLLVLAGILLGPLLLNWRAVNLNLRGLQIERKLPLGRSAGDLLSVSFHLTNVRRRLASWAVEAEDQIRRETGDGRENHPRRPPWQPQVLFPYVPAGESRRGTYCGRIAERGRYRFGPVRLSTRFPFGLFSRTVTVGDAETLTVLPRLGRLTEGWAMRRLEALAGTVRRRGQAGPEGDFYGVRDWHSGDSRRLIHWRGSARLGRLVSRQFEQPRSRDVAVVVDLWPSDLPADQHPEHVELAVSFAATVLADACRNGGSNVHLACSSGEPECLGGAASPALLQGLLEQLAVVEPPAHDTLPALFAHALRHIDAGTEVVLVSTRAVDPTNALQFAAVRSNPALRERARNVRCVDTSSPQLSQFFTAE